MPTIVRSSGGGGGADMSALTSPASTSDVLQDKQFYGAGSDGPQTGTMKNNGAVSVTAPYSGSGYYSSITISTTGNAEASHVLSGKTFTNSKGEQTGSMVNRSSKTTINVGETSGAGYYSSISVNKSSLGNAQAEHVLSTVTFTNSNGSTQKGSMTDQGSIDESLSYGGKFTGTAGYYSSINVVAPSRYGSATQAHVLNNVSFMNSSGNYASGTIATYGDTTKTISPGGSWSGAGYYKSIKVSASSASYSGNATAGVVRSGYTFMNSSGGPYTGSYTPAATKVYHDTVSVNMSWKTVDLGFAPSYYAIGYDSSDWSGTRYGIKRYVEGNYLHFCEQGSNTSTKTARIVAYA